MSFDRPLTAWNEPTEDATDWVSSDLTISTKAKACTCECTAPNSGQASQPLLSQDEQFTPSASPECPWKLVVFVRKAMANGSMSPWADVAETGKPGTVTIVPGQKMGIAARFFMKTVQSPQFRSGTTEPVGWSGIDTSIDSSGGCVGSPTLCAIAGYQPSAGAAVPTALRDLHRALKANATVFPLYFLNDNEPGVITVSGKAPDGTALSGTFSAPLGVDSSLVGHGCPVGIASQGYTNPPLNGKRQPLPVPPPYMGVGETPNCHQSPVTVGKGKYNNAAYPYGMEYLGSVAPPGDAKGCVALTQLVLPSESPASGTPLPLPLSPAESSYRLDGSWPWLVRPTPVYEGFASTDTFIFDVDSPSAYLGVYRAPHGPPTWAGFGAELKMYLMYRMGPCPDARGGSADTNIWVAMRYFSWVFSGIAYCAPPPNKGSHNLWRLQGHRNPLPNYESQVFSGEPTWHSEQPVPNPNAIHWVNTSGCN